MPQQLNLSIVTLRAPKQHFSAVALLQALAVVVVVGGGLCAYWVTSLRAASAMQTDILAQNTKELATLQATLERAKADAALSAGGELPGLQSTRNDIVRREQLLIELRRGLYREGFGQSARLQLVAQSIPARAWVSEIKGEDGQLEVSGFILDPAALNDWVGRLAASPLLQGQHLSTVRVENTQWAAAGPVKSGVVPAQMPAAAGSAARPPLWSFTLTSVLHTLSSPVTPVSPGVPAALGSQP